MITFYEIVRYLHKRGYKCVRPYAGTNAEQWNKGDHFIDVQVGSMNPYQFKDFSKCLI